MSNSLSHESFALPAGKPRLVIVGSARAQHLPSSPLLRLMRDFAANFGRYEIHATEETAEAILGTGLYSKDAVVRHRPGDDGGITQLAAMIARREVAAAILLLDPNDPWSDAVENRALARVCIHRQVRLITTYAAALRWLTFEAVGVGNSRKKQVPEDWKPLSWREGNKNVDRRGEFQQIPVKQRSIALISHDGKKDEMVDFINSKDHLSLLASHDRILATGTTGWLLKLLFCNDIAPYRSELKGKEKRLSKVITEILKKKKINPTEFSPLEDLLKELRNAIGAKRDRTFSDKVMPLPSGPDGGDVLAADEILNNKLHEVIFFQDPLEAHPHSEDIRLFERTSRLPGVFSECVSDKASASHWMNGLRKEMKEGRQIPTLSQRLRSTYGLREVILIDGGNNRDGEELGTSLARACAGFLNQTLHASDANRHARIGVAWGWGLRRVLMELAKMHDEKLLRKPQVTPDLTWTPIIGVITAQMTDQEASMVADGFANFYGGHLERLGCAGFAPAERTIPADVRDIIANLENADLILTSGSGWDSQASLARSTGLDTKKLPEFQSVAGIVSGVFLDEDGDEVRGEYEIVGLGYKGLKNAAAKGAVVLMCGGQKRNKIVLSALRARMVSVLISTKNTAKWVLTQPGPETIAARSGQSTPTAQRKKPAAKAKSTASKRAARKPRVNG
jgi:methylglyoxal synthase